MKFIKKHKIIISGVLIILSASVFIYNRPSLRRSRWVTENLASYRPAKSFSGIDKIQCSLILKKARDLTQAGVKYDPSYVVLPFPGGDVSPSKGVCADMIIRGARAINVDLQLKLNEDLKANFSSYPKLWSLKSPDHSIDHRRVPNLMTYFQRQGLSLELSSKNEDYKPCDIVSWNLGGGLTHIGWVSDEKTMFGTPLILHHIGGNPTEEDVLFSWDIIGHYRFK